MKEMIHRFHSRYEQGENMTDKIGRNDPCHCGSGKKYKKCCMTKDKEEKKNAKVSVGLPPHDKYIFDSKEEILESIRAEGFEPVATEYADEVDGEIYPYLSIELCCKHGHSEACRVYTLEEDEKWELIEEGRGTLCPECSNKSETK
jgi:hypothetical protein